MNRLFDRLFRPRLVPEGHIEKDDPRAVVAIDRFNRQAGYDIRKAMPDSYWRVAAKGDDVVIMLSGLGVQTVFQLLDRKTSLTVADRVSSEGGKTK